MAHTVMVTGADGFIGSHLTEELVKRGEKVRAFCLYNSFGSLGWIDTLPPEIRNEIDVFMGDVRDPNGVRTAMRGQERVFHLAALIAIPFSYHSPDSYVDTNIKGTLNVLNAARELDTQRVLVTSTSEVYGTAQYVPIDEKHPFQGQSPYSATKIGADRLAESFYRSFDLPVTIVRPFNTYGPRQSGRAIIPTIITQLLAGQTEIKLGSLTPTRDFNYVKDTANGFMTIADCDAAIGQELNIATGVEHSIGDLANELIAQINPNAKIVCEAERLRPAKSEVNRLLGDSTKLRNLTGWAPQYTFEQGLAATIEFLRGNLDQYRPHNRSVSSCSKGRYSSAMRSIYRSMAAFWLSGPPKVCREGKGMVSTSRACSWGRRLSSLACSTASCSAHRSPCGRSVLFRYHSKSSQVAALAGSTASNSWLPVQDKSPKKRNPSKKGSPKPAFRF